MAQEEWVVAPGDTLTLELEDVHRLKSALIGGALDVIGHDDAATRLEITEVEGREITITLEDGRLTVDHPRLGFERFMNAITGKNDGRESSWGGYSKAKARISVAVPRTIAIELGQVSASTLLSGVTNGASVNTVSGEIQVESIIGRLDSNTVSGEVSVVNHEGPIHLHTVSGDLTATGRIEELHANSVSGNIFVDARGPLRRIDVNTVSGSVTARVDAGPKIELKSNSASGTVTVDALSVARNTQFVSDGDPELPPIVIGVNTVSGRVSVMRRGSGAA